MPSSSAIAARSIPASSVFPITDTFTRGVAFASIPEVAVDPGSYGEELAGHARHVPEVLREDEPCRRPGT